VLQWCNKPPRKAERDMQIFNASQVRAAREDVSVA
jgi:hypothetical protein